MDRGKIMTLEFMAETEKELEFNRMIVAEYLKWGSVDEIFSRHNYDLPISYPGVHRILNRWEIVKSAGPNTHLAESLAFFTRLLEERIPLERLYKKMPPSFNTSMATLHRIYGNIKKQVKDELEERNPLRMGTALVISPYDDKYKILTAVDISTPRIDLGKPYGAVSLPMGFSKRKESGETSILRVLQQEAFSEETILQEFPYQVIPEGAKPFMYLYIADVKVSVYRMTMPPDLSCEEGFSSLKLKGFRFVEASELANYSVSDAHIRMGVGDIARGYLDRLSQDISYKPITPKYYDSQLNLGLAALAFDFVE